MRPKPGKSSTKTTPDPVFFPSELSEAWTDNLSMPLFCRFAGKNAFFHSPRTGQRCAAASHFTFSKPELSGAVSTNFIFISNKNKKTDYRMACHPSEKARRGKDGAWGEELQERLSFGKAGPLARQPRPKAAAGRTRCDGCPPIRPSRRAREPAPRRPAPEKDRRRRAGVPPGPAASGRRRAGIPAGDAPAARY